MGFAHCRRPPCCWFLAVCFLVFFSLLKCVLARWFLDVSFQVTSLTHNCKLGDGFWHCWCPKPIVWQAWWFHFGSLGVHFGTLGHHGGPWEQQEGHVGVWNRILIDFGTILELILRVFLAPRAETLFCFRACFQITFCTDC